MPQTDSIQIVNLKKSYKNKLHHPPKEVLHDLSLTIQKGESFGFLGPNGAGKSTLIKILMNFIGFDSGEIKIFSQNIKDPSVRSKIGFLPEHPAFYDHLTPVELLGFAAKISKIPHKEAKKRIEKLLTQLQLDGVQNQKIRTFSKGMTQRVGLALAVIHDPELCVLDEPMSGLDPMGRKLVCDFIIDMKESGKTIFFSSHILSDVERICDRIGILNKGSLLYCGSIQDFTASTQDLESAFVTTIEENNTIEKDFS